MAKMGNSVLISIYANGGKFALSGGKSRQSVVSQARPSYEEIEKGSGE